MILRFKAIVLLFVLFGYFVRPILPFIEYALNKNYIEKNLCINRDKPKSSCHGKCHLKKQLAHQAEENQADKKTENKKLVSVNENIEFTSNESKSTTITFILKKHVFETKIFSYSSPSSFIFVPPQHLI